MSDAGNALYACGLCAGHFAGRAPVAVTNGQESYFIFCDQLGTPLALANLDGHIVQSMRYDSFGNLLQAPGEAERRAVRLPLGFAGGLYDSDTGLTRALLITGWRDYDADTGRFTALDPLGAKGGDRDWYGYCVDDPVNRADVWGLEAKDNEPYYCNWTECDGKGTMQGDYKPIEGTPGKEPFLLDFSFPLPDILAGPFRNIEPKEVRIPLGVDYTTPFRIYYDKKTKQEKQSL